MKLSIVIPVYNEKNTIAQIVESVRAVEGAEGLQKEIVIVDDGSKDGTVEVLKRLQNEQPDLKIYFKEKNAGKGDTLRIGFQHTTGDYVIVQDADLEYDPQDYNRLIKSLNDNHAQVVYGSRFSGDYKDMMNLHVLGNKFLTFVTNLIFGVKLSDMETCYKLIPGDFARKIKINSARFNFEPEITAKILKSGMKIIEVPISYRGRNYNEGKHITWKDGFSALYTLIKYKFVD